MQTANESVPVFECSDTEELLESLRTKVRETVPSDPRPYQWAYRGQANANWKLIPTALRPGTVLGFYPDRRQHISKGHGASMEQMNGEVVAVRQFAELADRVGLPIPGFIPFYRQDGFDIDNYGVAAVAGQLGTAEWPLPEMLELLAIAQHHGVPTRLLDFTYDPLVALFFAAVDIVKNRENHTGKGATELAVWAVNLHETYKKERSLGMVEVERAQNPFLFAQKGLFLFDKRISDCSRNAVSLSLDERILDLYGKEELDLPIVKFTMPAEQARDSLNALSLRGVDRPHLMPTYDNVVAHLKTLSESS